MRVRSAIKQVAFLVMCVTWSVHMVYIFTKQDQVHDSEENPQSSVHIREQMKAKAAVADAEGVNPWNLELMEAPRPGRGVVKANKDNDDHNDEENPWIMDNQRVDEPLLKVDSQRADDDTPKQIQKLTFSDPAEGNQEGHRNPHPFEFMHKCDGLCKHQDVFLVVQVHSNAHNAERRDVIRQTWGKSEIYDVGVRVLFIMGMTDSSDLQVELDHEATIYGDIAQENFMDTYHNLTYKGIAGLRWLHNNCPGAHFLLKADDDAFVNMPALLKHLKDIERSNRGDKFILCRTWWKMHVLRGESKYAVEESEYPLPFYPPYCSGLAFVLTVDVALELYRASFSVPFFWVDDVYITGMLPYVLGLSHTQFIHAYIKPDEMDAFKRATWYKYMFVHLRDMDLSLQYWQHLLVAAKRHPIPEVEHIFPGLIAGNNQTNLLDTPPDEVLKVDFDKYLDQH